MGRDVTCARLPSRPSGTRGARALGREEMCRHFSAPGVYTPGYSLPRLRRSALKRIDCGPVGQAGRSGVLLERPC